MINMDEVVRAYFVNTMITLLGMPYGLHNIRIHEEGDWYNHIGTYRLFKRPEYYGA